MNDATSVTIYPDETTQYSAHARISETHGTICRVNVDFCTGIQTNSWQEMQRLIDALEDAITQAKHAEETTALGELVSA